MLKKTRKQILTLGIAGLVGAGTLFSGIASTGVYAQEEATVDNAIENEEAQTSSDKGAEVKNSDKSKEASDDKGADLKETDTAKSDENSSDRENSTDDNTTDEEKNKNEKKSVKQTEDNPPVKSEETKKEEADNESGDTKAEDTTDDTVKEENNVKAEVESDSQVVTFNIKNSLGEPIIDARATLYKTDESMVQDVIKDRSQFEGQDLVDNTVQGNLKEAGNPVASWSTSTDGYELNINPGFYVLFTNILWSNNLYIKVSQEGSIQKGYYDYDSKVINWGNNDSDVITYNYSAYDNLESKVNPKIRVRDMRFKGGSVDGVEVVLYKKTASGLQEVRGNRNSRGEFEYSIDYPADYIIKNTDIAEGYKKFADVEFSVIRNTQMGFAEFRLTDKSRNDIDLISYIDYNFPKSSDYRKAP